MIDKGVVVEEGNHSSLMDAQGIYFGLVQQQNVPEIEEDKQLSFKQQENIEEIQTDSIEDPNIINLTSIDNIDKKKKNSITLNMLLMNKPEWIFIIFGCLSCICNGGIQPAFGIILSKLTAVNCFFLNFYKKKLNFIEKRFFKNVMNKFKNNKF